MEDQLHKDLAEMKQQLARVLVLLEIAVALEPRVRELEKQQAVMAAKAGLLGGVVALIGTIASRFLLP